MKLKHYTLKPYQLESKHLSQIHNIIEKVVGEKKDEYWDNYTDYSVFDQTMITIGIIDDEVKTFSSIYTREFYGEYVYRLLNRWLMSDDIREFFAFRMMLFGIMLEKILNKETQIQKIIKQFQH